MQYHLPCVYERGLTNGVNALAALEQLVFNERAYRLSEIVAALRSNFAGAEALLARLRGAPKWGNGDPRVDRWAQALLEMRERVLQAVDARTGTGPHVVCHVVRSLHYFDGKRIGASPDGRLAWMPVSDSIGAELGTARRGPTGVLQSVLKVDAARYYRGGYNLNLTLPMAQWGQPDMLENLHALITAFLSDNGQELQVGVLDADLLSNAQQHPEHYGDLIVRIAGFNARFVDLSPVEQTELIQRARCAAI
jgi:formate C-acetyltransferase